MNQAVHQVPEGYKADAKGRLIPVAQIKPIDLARDQLVEGIVEKSRVLSEVLAKLKTEIFADIAAFEELAAEQYQVRLGGSKGNLTLVSFDGRFKVQRAIQENLTFDEGLQIAKALIDECLREWAEGAASELKTIVTGAFEVDQQGKINTRRVLSLRRYHISDERWKRAMEALSDSVRVQNSKSYIRVYERLGDTDLYQAIPLDIAAV